MQGPIIWLFSAEQPLLSETFWSVNSFWLAYPWCSTFPPGIPGRPWGQGDQTQHDLPSPWKEFKAWASSLCGGERNSEKVSCKDYWDLMLPKRGAHSSTHVAWLLWLWLAELEACFSVLETQIPRSTLCFPSESLGQVEKWPWGSQVDRHPSF
jgi:hypothetical protein